MTTCRFSFAAACALLALPTASATLITEAPRIYNVGYTLADLENPPRSFLLDITDSTILSLTKVQVGLQLSGVTPGSGFAGEMFVSLNRDLSLTSVLLNRVGMTSSNPVGLAYNGWNVTFADDAASGDIHPVTLSAGVLTGLWQPDGRTFPTDTDRPSLLDVFDNSAGNGAWRLNVADLDLGGTMRLTSWSLTLTGEGSGVPQVPETSTVAAGVALVLLLGSQFLRRRSLGSSAMRLCPTPACSSSPAGSASAGHTLPNP